MPGRFGAVFLALASAHLSVAMSPPPAGAASEPTVPSPVTGLVEVTGTLFVGHTHEPASTFFALETASENLELNASEPVAFELAALAGHEVRVRGLRAGAVVHVSTFADVAPPPDDDELTEARAFNAGAKRIAVILVKAPGPPAFPITPDAARALVFTGAQSTNAYFQEATGGAVSLRGALRADGDVFGPYDVPAPLFEGRCSYTLLAARAKDSATPHGYNAEAYRTTVLMHTVPGCSTGLALGDDAFVGPNGAPFVLAHEIGHTFGLAHAASYNCRDGLGMRVAISGVCSAQLFEEEYGDPFDAMGGSVTLRHFHAFHKRRLDGMPAGNVQTVTTDRTLTLTNSSQPRAGVTQLVKVPRRKRADGTPIDWYLLELRKPYGSFDAYAPSDPVVRGVTVRVGPNYEPGGGGGSDTQLIDTTPETPTFLDAALAAGRNVVDPNRGIRISTLSVDLNAGTARVRIDFIPPVRPKAEVVQGTLRFTAPDGQQNIVTFEQRASTVVDVFDEHQTIALGNGCSRVLGDGARCTGVRRIEADGADGDDTLNARAVALPVVLRGGRGSDTLFGGFATDRLEGGDGPDRFEGVHDIRDGADTIIGGNDSAEDTVSYAMRREAVIVTLGNGLDDDGEVGERDRIEEVEVVHGGSGSDVFVGTAGAETFVGGSGSDVFVGGAGADAFEGGLELEDTDWVLYGDHPAGVRVSLDGAANDGSPGEGDNVWPGIDRVVGGAGADTFTTGGPIGYGVTFDGAGGNDRFVDPAPGFAFRLDHFIGGSGVDWLDYGARTTAILAVPGTGGNGQLPANGVGEGDVIDASIEHIVGGSGNDILFGSATANVLLGNGGNDVLVGGAGVDVLIGGPGEDYIVAVDGTQDWIACDAGSDTVRADLPPAPVVDALLDPIQCELRLAS